MRCHVDACIGGWVLPYAARLGRAVTPWTFAVEGVTSISVDLHKYAYAPKGTSVLLHRTPALRRPQFFASAAWPGYTMLNSTTAVHQVRRPAGRRLGRGRPRSATTGYLRLAARGLRGGRRIVAGIGGMPALRVVVQPDSTLVALATDDSCDPFTITDEMARAGGTSSRSCRTAASPPTHPPLGERRDRAPHVDEFLAALRESVAAAQAAGPVAGRPRRGRLHRGAGPGDAGRRRLRRPARRVGAGGRAGRRALALPERMAEVNALLDVASPAMREALLVAFLDRLSATGCAEAALHAGLAC